MKYIPGMLALFVAAFASTQFARGQGSTFTYQGHLTHAGNPANGLYEMDFTLLAAPANGSPVGGPVHVAPVVVSNGLFTVLLDYGANVFMGGGRWLEITVTVFGSDQPPVTLLPRQLITPTPYALHASNAANLMNFANMPIDIKVNGQRALRLEAATKSLGTAPNVIGGSEVNFVAAGVVGATIGGGGATIYDGGAHTNRVEEDFGTIAGGQANVSRGFASTIGGGAANVSSDNSSTVAGGSSNTSSGQSSTVGGGIGNTSSGSGATVGGGAGNLSSGTFATVGGGENNASASPYSAVGGGGFNQIRTNSNASTIGGGIENLIEPGSFWSTISGGSGNFIATNASGSSISGGTEHIIRAQAANSTIGGGFVNIIASPSATICGGGQNRIPINAALATICGGYGHNATAQYAFIGGGNNNIASGVYAAVAGGAINMATARGAFIGGGGGEDEDGANFPNVASGRWSVVTAGSSNAATGNFSAIGGGHGNSVGLDSSFSTIAGGEGNTIASEAWNSTIGGGEINLIETQSDTATIAGGGYNTIRASADSATIAGGDHNEVAAKNATVGGGLQNRAMGEAATVPGGRGNSAQGAYSFAAGRRATAGHAGAFVWADSTDSDLNSSTNDQFTVRASGGVRFFTATNATAGAELAPGSGSWSMLSDRNAKENFIPANGREILEKVAALPLATWNYKAQDKSIRHLGPMAQDFKAAFNLGENHTTITTVDADGVALAAIQGLNQKLEEQLKIKDAHIEALQRRMERLEKLLSHH